MVSDRHLCIFWSIFHDSINKWLFLVISDLAKAKPRSITPTVKNVKKELIEPKLFDESLDYQNDNSMITTKTESTQDFEGDDDDEFSHDGYSHSINSLQSTSLPPTPEPNEAQMWNSNRPSSKSSSVSVNSGTNTSTPPPERKATSYINVSILSWFLHSLTKIQCLTKFVRSLKIEYLKIE